MRCNAWRSCSRTPASSCPRWPPTSSGSRGGRCSRRIAGERDPAALADLAQQRLRTKIPQLIEALTGRFTEHHAFLVRMHLDLIDQHTAAIEELTDRIEVVIEPFRGFYDLICTIPGIGTTTAEVIIAETGADMTRFPTAGHLASWAGTTPDTTSRPARSSPPTPGPATPTSKACWAPRRWRCHTRGPTSAPATDASRPDAAREGQRRDPAPCSSRSGTWAPPAPSTTTPEPTTSPDSTPESPKQRHPPARSHGLPRHPRPNVLTAPLSAPITSRESSRQPCWPAKPIRRP